MPVAKKQDIEMQLLGEDQARRVTVQDLELADQMAVSDDETIFINDDGTFSRQTKPYKKLEGAEAMAFLNLPPRQFNLLKKGDLHRIRWKFKDWFEQIVRENKPGRNENKLFWDNIRVRVVNKQYAGKETRGIPSLGVAPGTYNGDILTGEAIKTFLPETSRSNADGKFIVQLLSIKVSEELENV